RLDEHAVIPLPPRAHFGIGGIPSRSMEGRIAEDHHPSVTLPHQRLKSLVRDIGGGTIPRHDQSPLVPQEASCPTDNPAVVRQAFPASLPEPAPVADGVNQFHPLR